MTYEELKQKAEELAQMARDFIHPDQKTAERVCDKFLSSAQIYATLALAEALERNTETRLVANKS